MTSETRRRPRSLLLFAIVGPAVVAAMIYGWNLRPRGAGTPAPKVAPPPIHPVGGPAIGEAERPPEVWGIVVGIDQYRDEAIPDCHGAVRDARAVARWLEESAGWGGDHVLLIVDEGRASPTGTGAGPPAPTREGLDRAFREWLPARVRPGDTVAIYFAGQAVATGPRAGAGPSEPGHQILLPSDARSADLDGSGWRLDEAIDDLAAKGTTPIVCWLDTSLDGRGRPVPRGTGGGAAASSFLRRLARWPGVTAWLAADGHPAREAPRAGDPGPFAAALIAGLGTRERPRNLYACLNEIAHDPALARQGFRSLGGVDPDLNLWTRSIRQASHLHRQMLLQRGHAAGITAVACTADGARMVTASQDSTIKIWDPAGRRLLRVLSYHLVGVTSLALSPDGRLLASGDGAGRLRVWDLVADRLLPESPPHARGVDTVGFLPDGQHLASLDMDGKAWLWDVLDPAAPPRLLSEGSTAIACASRRGPVGLAIALRGGKLQVFGPEAGSPATVDGPGGVVSGRALATDGHAVVAGADDGTFLVWDAEAKARRIARTFGAAIDAVGLSAGGDLAVASGDTLHWLSMETRPPGRPPLTLGEPANGVVFSPDGRWLACATRRGRLLAWQGDEASGVVRMALEGDDPAGESTALAFAPDGRTLVSGDRDGGTRSWRIPGGDRLPGIEARRGQVIDLSLSSDAGYLLQVTRDGKAQVWDLREGRALGKIDGSWSSGVLTPNGLVAIVADRELGEVIACDRATGRRHSTRFARPEAVAGGGVAVKVGKLTISRDGRWLAGAVVEAPLACGWDAATGRLVQTIRGHEAPARLTAVGFSADSRRMLTAAEDGTAVVLEWEPSAPDKPARRAREFRLADGPDSEPIPITAAGLAPGDEIRVAAGGIDGRVVLWTPGASAPTRLGEIEGAVSAMTFTGDGRWLAVSGPDKSIWLYGADGSGRRGRLGPNPRHDEQVNVLLAWPDSRLIASGSDDTTIRLWEVDGRELLGTLSADQATTDWVAYTPEGLFDASIGAEGQLAWLDGADVLSLDQVGPSQHVFKLTNEVRLGRKPKAPEAPHAVPPRLSIDEPRTAPDRPSAELTIAMSEAGLADLRLYHNGVPVQSEGDLKPDPSGRRFTAKVPLRRGLNRFYAMAGRPGGSGVEGRSEVVEVRYAGPESPGRTHILALGVSHYTPESWGLQFADRDARNLADFLQQSAPSGGQSPGLKIVLLNEAVTGDAVEEALGRIREEVKGRPQDTVVVFLAGHAGVQDDRFRLLLSRFPFREGEGAGVAPPVPAVGRDEALPYTAIYRDLVRLGALQRLVVIDACQAGAISDDPGVRMIQRLVDGGSRRAKTAYLLAARRGEPTGEVSALKHGLLTYAMLRGMAAPDLESVPGLTVLDEQPDADRDRDGVVTTDELRVYTDWAMTRLSSAFPVLAMRQADGARGVAPKANLNQAPRIEASDASFPLIPLPRKASP